MAKQASLEGLAECLKKLERVEKEMRPKLIRQAFVNGATPVVREAKQRIPVGDEAHRTYKGNLVSPGFAKRSIRKASRLADGKVIVMIGVRREAFYATQFVELGTRYQDAQDWLRPALESKRDEAQARIVQQLRAKIKKVTRA